MKEFIPYEQALELKELEFEEPCFGVYVENELFIVSTERPSIQSHSLYQGLAPLYQQVFRWFREKHGLHAVVDINISDEWYFLIFNLNAKRNAEVVKKDEYYNTYEEAELACLNKLIEIVKTK
jgi:hypothetical protein